MRVFDRLTRRYLHLNQPVFVLFARQAGIARVSEIDYHGRRTDPLWSELIFSLGNVGQAAYFSGMKAAPVLRLSSLSILPDETRVTYSSYISL